MLKLKSRLWIVDENDRIIMGEGRREILEHIERTGSISQAAKEMRMSYKAVWGKIKASENSFKTAIVRTDRGKGARLTREGKALLKKYRTFKEECSKAEGRIFSTVFKQKDRRVKGID